MRKRKYKDVSEHCLYCGRLERCKSPYKKCKRFIHDHAIKDPYLQTWGDDLAFRGYKWGI